MSVREDHKYDDIINLPHHVSSRHPQLSALDRAAQFSPFAALTGHDAAIQETARLTEEFVELDEDGKEALDERLQLIREVLRHRGASGDMPEIEVTYFRPDQKKSGGAYVTVRGKVKKIDEYNRRLHFEDQTVIPMERLCSIEGELFGRV